MNLNKIIESLKTIQEICEASDCQRCVFYKYNRLFDTNCGLKIIPQDWEIKTLNELEKENQQVFK